MAQATLELDSFFSAELNRENIERFADLAYATHPAREQFAALVAGQAGDRKPSGEDALRLALAHYVLGNYQESLDLFVRATDDKNRHYMPPKPPRRPPKSTPPVRPSMRSAAIAWDCSIA